MPKLALVTGGGRGIGRSIALALARDGTDVALAYVSHSRCAEQTASEIRTLGRQALVIRADVADRASVQRLVSLTVETFGRIDILVNNAGILLQKPFDAITEDEWDRTLAVNLKGAFLCSQEAMRVMAPRRSGSIINIASSGAQLGGTLAVHYAVSKAGLISLTKCLARVGSRFGIRVNCVAPGLIHTEMTSQEIASPAGAEKIEEGILLRRVGSAEEVAAAATFLASEQASYITGHTLNVNGGLYLA